MQSRSRALLLCLLAAPAICIDALAQSVDATRTARDNAKADLIRAREAFDQTDEAYIKALGGAAATPAASAPARTSAATPGLAGKRPGIVTFSLSGSRVMEVNPLEYRGRIIIDGQAGSWTQHASGAKESVPLGTHSLSYEVQSNEKGDTNNPRWKTICDGNLPLKADTTVDIALGAKTLCNAR